MATVRAVVRLPFFTNTPEDTVVNTFHYTAVAFGSVQTGTLFDALVDFYNTTSGSGILATYLAPYLSRVANACTVDMYLLEDPEPRQPIFTGQFTLGASSGTGTLPGEVAKCLSYRAAYVSGEPNARRRGRIYVGPLSSAALTLGTASAFPVPNTNFDDVLIASADLFLVNAALAEGMTWSVYSPTDLLARPITDIWVDNAFDTQRRRGNAPTARQTLYVGP